MCIVLVCVVLVLVTLLLVGVYIAIWVGVVFGFVWWLVAFAAWGFVVSLVFGFGGVRAFVVQLDFLGL